MFKQSMKNFIVNLKYVFTPLGILSLGLIIGFSVAIPWLMSETGTMVKSVENLFMNANIDFSSFGNTVYSFLKEINWTNPDEIIATLTDEQWLMKVITECANNSDLTVILDQISELIENYSDKINIAIGTVVIFAGFSILGGFFVTKIIIRRDIAKRNLKKLILALLIDSLISATIVSACMYFVTVWAPSIFISTVLSFVLYGFVALLEAYIIHGWKKINIKDVITFKNIAYLILSSLLIFGISLAVSSITTVLTNNIVGWILGISLFIVAFIVINLNSESYVKKRVIELKAGKDNLENNSALGAGMEKTNG